MGKNRTLLQLLFIVLISSCIISACSSQDPALDAEKPAIKIAWDANTESDLAGYRIYYGTAPGAYTHNIDAGNVTSYSLKGLDPKITYYISITAYDASGNESSHSGEVSGNPQ